MNLLHLAIALSCLGAVLRLPALAQTRANPVAEDSGPLRDLSTNVGAGSGPVRGSISKLPSTAGTLNDRSVRGSVSGDLVSGPVSDLSRGAVTSGRAVAGGGSVVAASVGAVKKDAESPLGEMISQPLRELGPLQEQLRSIQPLPRNAPLAEEEAGPAPAPPRVSAPQLATQPEEPTEDVGSEAADDEAEPLSPGEDDGVEQKSVTAQAAPPPAAAPTPQPTSP
ncbi:MAG TPA: hypothetical protein VMW56_16440 [Candidatus Margulisiibacteriota bacterium]|nr:hypothetical protein [Candidatus Margulisiibacteriota bacterium]